MSSGEEHVKVKCEWEDNNSNFSNEEQCDTSQMGELFNIKTVEGATVPIYLRAGNRLLFGSGKYFHIEHTTSFTDYQRENTGLTCICHSCGTRIKGSLKVSSNFICHLKNKHPELHQEFLKQKTEYSASNQKSYKRASVGIHRSSPYQVPSHNSLHNSEKHEQLHNKILKFVIETNQSYNIVQAPSFIKLFEFVDFPVQMRAADYYEQVVKDACEYKKSELYHAFNTCRAYVCKSVDAWSYAGSKYVAIACHWINDHYERQTTMLTCRKIKGIEMLDSLQKQLLHRNGIITENITAAPTFNIASYQQDFINFGVLKEVFVEEFSFVSEQKVDNLEFVELNYQNLVKLDIQKLNRIWGTNFVQKLSANLQNVHKSVMEKCSQFWICSLSKDSIFQSMLNEPITKPNLCSFVSLYQAMKQLLAHADKMDHIFCLMQKTPFTPMELSYLAELQEIFEPLSAAYAFLDSSHNHYYGCFLPTLVTLKWKLTRLYNSNRLQHLQEALLALKEELLCEFQEYYDLNESKFEAIIAALTYPPVKTRFIMGLKDNSPSFHFQPQQILRKYGNEYHVVQEHKSNDATMNYALNSHNPMSNSTGASTDFFDFGDTAVDAEELRDVNISKKEVAELMKELFSDLNEGISFDNIELETSSKVMQSCQAENLVTPNTSPERVQLATQLTEHLDFMQQPESATLSQSSAVTSSNVTQHDISFHPGVMSTPSRNGNVKHVDCDNDALIPIANAIQNTTCSPGSQVTISGSNVNSEVEFIALPVPGQPNHYQLAKIVNSDDTAQTNHKQHLLEAPTESSVEELAPKPDMRYDGPYETNYSNLYISLKRHAYTEFKEKFDESLKQAQVNQISSTTCEAELDDEKRSGFTRYQYDLMQQQMRIHVQMLTQTYVQTYCHPSLWKLAKKPKEMLMELKTKAETNNNFKIWNLESAIKLIESWQQELDEDTEANKQLMAFMHSEIEMTNHNTRQIPRFHTRMLECFLESNVFMYPEYLPRMPFSAKVIQFETFSPVEMYLIAMGLEKHLKVITERKERIPAKSTALRVACNRLAKDTIRGKSNRIVWNYIQRCKNADFYNPIKYYLDNGKAPPVEYTPIIGFENNIVPPPKDRIHELPLVFKTYLEAKNAPPKEKKRRKRASRSRIKVSDNCRKSYVEFVREALGEDVTLYDNCKEVAQPDAGVSVGPNKVKTPEGGAKSTSTVQKSRSKCRVAENLTINVNYVFGAGPATTSYLAPTPESSSALTLPPLLWTNDTDSGVSLNTNDKTTEVSVPNEIVQDTSLKQSINSSLNLPGSIPKISQPVDNIPVITYNFNLTTQTLESCTAETTKFSDQRLTNPTEITADNNPLNCTSLPAKHQINQIQNKKQENNIKIAYKNKKKPGKRTRILSYVFKLHTKTKRKAVSYQEKRQIKRRCEDLITAYGLYLDALQLRFQHVPIIQRYYRKFKALELYTNLLTSLKRICTQNSLQEKATSAVMSTSSVSSSSGVKRSRSYNAEDESSPSSQRMARKIYRQEENFRQMLLPDTPEEANRKDAVYAFNFYEKVEEAFRTSNRPDDCRKFNAILKSFDPNIDKVSELYNKLEKLFLPDHPELAQVFLTFILPSDAAEIGKFFEHFMINNMATFINKLNIYFNKQPAQVRKIYNCLNELADDPDVSIKKVETKIVPLLKGNQCLRDWFMQQFPQTVPPERLFGNPENIPNLKEQETNRTGEYVEAIADLLDSPTSENQTQQACQLRYINGRIFYGSKMLLPAKLSFMASSFKETPVMNQVTYPPMPSASCVHAVKDHGDKRLQSAAELACATTTTESNDDQDKSEEDDHSKQLIIDTTAEEDDSCSSIEACDENALKSHAMRLNPSYYGSACYASNATSTPNLNSNFQSHHSHAKKTSLNFNEPENASGSTNAGKTSPRKCLSQPSNHTPLANSNLSFINTREKRKSPCKKTRSPLNNSAARSARSCNQPMVVIYGTSPAIQCAKRLKTLVESTESNEEIMDTKEHINIIARTKSSMRTTAGSNLDCITVDDGVSIKKLESVKHVNSDDLEFLPEDQHSSVTRSPFPALKLDTDSNEEDVAIAEPITSKATGSPSNGELPPTNLAKSKETSISTEDTNAAWTRDEDKTILIEMKLDSKNREELFHRIAEKLTQRTMAEIMDRHKFLVDFLSKLQKK